VQDDRIWKKNIHIEEERHCRNIYDTSSLKKEIEEGEEKGSEMRNKEKQ
jgi:hypothetical protein